MRLAQLHNNDKSGYTNLLLHYINEDSFFNNKFDRAYPSEDYFGAESKIKGTGISKLIFCCLHWLSRVPKWHM